MSDSPTKPRKLPRRPKIKLPISSQFTGPYSQTPLSYVTTPYGQTTMPVTPVSGQPTIIYANKASDFVIGHFKDFKDWTKSGLSAGEKCAFWLYEKVSSWSKRWFTHIFLFFVLFLYSILGAFLFIYIEGKYESAIQEDITKERDEMIQQIRDLWNDKDLVTDSEKWKGQAKNHLMLYEEKLYQFLKKLNFQNRPDSVNWAFWNAVIYCSTIYTTIVRGEESNSMDEDEDMRARMERMVEDTERMEEEAMIIEQDGSRSKSRQPEFEELKANQVKVKAQSPAVNRVDRFEEIPRGDESISREPPPEKRNSHELSPMRNQDLLRVEKHHSFKARRKSREFNDEANLKRRVSSAENSKARLSSSSSSSPPSNTSPRQHVQSDRRDSKKRVKSPRHFEYPSDEDDSPPGAEHPSRRKSSSRLIKKQVILLNDNRLSSDMENAERSYTHVDHYGYDDQQEVEDEVVPRYRRASRGASAHRQQRQEEKREKRKAADAEKEKIGESVDQSRSWFSWIPFFGKTRQKIEDAPKKIDQNKQKKNEKQTKEAFSTSNKAEKKTTLKTPEENSDKVTFREYFGVIRDIAAEFNEYCRQNPREVRILCELRNLCIVETIIAIIVCGLGGLVFRFTEGAFESFYKCGVKRVKRDFLDGLWDHSHNMKEDDWKSMARTKLREFEEQLHTAHEAGVQTYSGQRSWSFLNAMVYCLTIISTIGYGHISPSTTTGRALTIIYAIFGIPMFLIVLADFGKLFTRGIKFLWAFVRRLYYTGSCRKVRRTVPMQEMMKGVQLVYDLATFRRPSQMGPQDLAEIQRQQQTTLTVDNNTPQQGDSPSTPAMSTFEIDDEFNLPISVAITILILYIFIGAIIFNIVEDWSFFESFYFVFISMSTIGFGDFVPQEPLYMMLSIVYLIFGLALTSMCINVVQVMLADQFKQASQKIGASIGFQVSEEDGSLKPAAPDPVEVAEVHSTTGSLSSTNAQKLASKVKDEDDEF